MTTATSGMRPEGRQRYRHAARMEWIKLRSLRSTWWTLAITVLAAAGLAGAVGLKTRDGSGDLTNNALAGVAIGLLLTGVLGVLTMTGEYGSGLVRVTLAAVPDRRRLFLAKAGVFALLTVVTGEVASFLSFLAGTLTLRSGISAPTLADPGVLRAVLLSGVAFSLIGLLGLGLGALIRHTAWALTVLVGGVYVLSQVVAALAPALISFAPISIVANSLSITRPMDCAGSGPCPQVLSAWPGLALLIGYAAVVLALGGWRLARSDA